MLYKFKPLDKNKFTSSKMRSFAEEVSDVLTDRFFTKQELTEWVQKIPQLYLSYKPIDLYLDNEFEKRGDESIDNFLKGVDELGFAVDFSVSSKRLWVTKQDGTPLVQIDYDQYLKKGYIIEKDFYDIGGYYQVQIDKLISETKFVSLLEK